MLRKLRAREQDGALSASAERIAPRSDGWKNTGAGERHWQGWGIANDRVINPATGRPRSDDRRMNDLSAQHREYLAARRAKEAAAEAAMSALMPKLRNAVLRRDVVTTAATWRQMAAAGVSRDTIVAAIVQAQRGQAARRRRDAR
jgi:hypothetical protein